MHKLIVDMQYKVMFPANLFFMHEHSMKKPLLLGKLSHVLFYLQNRIIQRWNNIEISTTLQSIHELGSQIVAF